MKKRNLLLVLFVLALPLMVLYFLSVDEDDDLIDESRKQRTENRGPRQARPDTKSKVESRKSKRAETTKAENIKSESIKSKASADFLTERQNEIFDFIKQNKEVKMLELGNQFKNVTERTLRRDLARLQDLNLIGKKGSTKSALYFLY